MDYQENYIQQIITKFIGIKNDMDIYHYKTTEDYWIYIIYIDYDLEIKIKIDIWNIDIIKIKLDNVKYCLNKNGMKQKYFLYNKTNIKYNDVLIVKKTKLYNFCYHKNRKLYSKNNYHYYHKWVVFYKDYLFINHGNIIRIFFNRLNNLIKFIKKLFIDINYNLFYKTKYKNNLKLIIFVN